MSHRRCPDSRDSLYITLHYQVNYYYTLLHENVRAVSWITAVSESSYWQIPKRTAQPDASAVAGSARNPATRGVSVRLPNPVHIHRRIPTRAGNQTRFGNTYLTDSDADGAARNRSSRTINPVRRFWLGLATIYGGFFFFFFLWSLSWMQWRISGRLG